MAYQVILFFDIRNGVYKEELFPGLMLSAPVFKLWYKGSDGIMEVAGFALGIAGIAYGAND